MKEQTVYVPTPVTTWIDIFRKYKPDITDKEADYFLWNETCYPFDDAMTVRQIEKHYSHLHHQTTSKQ